MVWAFLSAHTDIFIEPRKRLLHIAPEPCLSRPLRSLLGDSYITADLRAKGVDMQLDITNIHLPDESFDVIYCSHVLEHVPDDRRAMRELCRVLKRDGWALLLVPMRSSLAVTDEDPTVTSPAERQRRFGNADHVRQYGFDYVDRLKESGFDVATHGPEIFSLKDIQRMGLHGGGVIHYCTRTM